MVESLIKGSAEKYIEALKKVQKNGSKEYYSFNIDCGSLKDYNNEDIRDDYKLLFSKLESMNGPVLY